MAERGRAACGDSATAAAAVTLGAQEEVRLGSGGFQAVERTITMSNNETEAALLAQGDLVADYLEELLDIADLDGDIENLVQDGRAFVAIDTDSELLVGKDGEVLDALQELSRLVVMTETGNRSRLMLDVGGFRARRRGGLRAITSGPGEGLSRCTATRHASGSIPSAICTWKPSTAPANGSG